MDTVGPSPQQPPVRPSMEDLGRELGVSVSTVSRALREHHSISEATRRKVKELARKRGYVPNPYISALMSTLRARRPAPYHATLALLDPLDHVDDWKKHAVQREFNHGIRTRAAELGYTVERHRVDACGKGGQLTRILRARGIRGVLLTPLATRFGQIPDILHWRHFSCVTVGFRLNSPPFHFCTNDQLASSELAFTRLHEAGCRRIGLVTSDYLEWVVDSKFSLGFRHAAEVLGVRLPAAFAHRLRDGPRGDSQIVRWLRKYRPDSLCGVRKDLERVSALAGREGMPMPYLASLDLDSGHPDGDGILQNNVQVGSSAVDLLVQLLHRGSTGIPDQTFGMIIEGSWFKASKS